MSDRGLEGVRLATSSAARSGSHSSALNLASPSRARMVTTWFSSARARVRTSSRESLSSVSAARSLSPRARRSWETFDCKVLRPALVGSILEQDVHAHAGARIEREPDQQLGGLACRHRQPITIPASLDCAENGDSEHHPRLRQRRPGEVSPGVVSAPSAPWSTVHVCPTPTPPSSSA